MELIILALVVVAMTVGAIVIGVMPNWLVMTVIVLAALPKLLWRILTGRMWQGAHYILRAAFRGTRRDLKALGINATRVDVVARWDTKNTTPPLDVVLWLVFDSDADAETAVPHRDRSLDILRNWLTARGWSEPQVAELRVGLVTAQEIEARGGGFHFSRGGYKPDERGRVGPAT